jgi:hypothetical protein
MPRLVSALIFAALASLAGSTLAQQRPEGLQPLPEPPAPPPGVLDSPIEPEVTIFQRGDDRVEEHRVNGKLYMIKVTPPHGTPYYLVDQRGDGNMLSHPMPQGPIDKPINVPMWVIHSF